MQSPCRVIGSRNLLPDCLLLLESSPDEFPFDAVLPGQLLMFPDDADETEEDEESRMLRKYGNASLMLFASATDYEFSAEETRVLFDMILPYYIAPENDAVSQVDFMRRLYHRMIQRAADSSLPQLKNRYQYLKKLLQNELDLESEL